jgi:hypothetical protein
LKALKDTLDSVLGSIPTPEALLRAVEEVDGQELIAALRANARRNANFARQLARRTYRHPNGFIRVAVCQLAHGGMLRVHQWREPVDNTQNDFHDHRGGFASKLIGGRLLNEEFRITDGSSHLRFEDVFTPPVHRLLARGDAGLVLDDATILRGEDSYYLSPEVIHRTSPLAPHRTTTVVIEDRPMRDRSTVLRIKGARDFEPTVAAAVDPLELIELLESLSTHAA